jgi:hypothetical protein
MTGYFVLAFIALIAPLSYFYGVDSRRREDRGWLAGSAATAPVAPGDFPPGAHATRSWKGPPQGRPVQSATLAR